MNKTRKLISIDFDGTLVENWNPHLGPTVPHAVEVLKKLQNAGHEFILMTMREGHLLDDAEEWARNNEIEFKYIMCNPEYETGSRKVYCHCSVDDKNAFTPLIFEDGKKPYVDWKKLEEWFYQRSFL
jgi:hydroxymethylpyrimidine pyrophosphatase-like HAD family hydrolase